MGEQAEDNIVEGEDKPEMTKETMPVEEVIATEIDVQAVEEINEVQQTWEEYVVVEEPEKEILPMEEETPSLDEDDNKESIEFIEKEEEENTTSEELTKLDKKEDIVPVEEGNAVEEVTIAEIESKVEVDVK